MFNYEETLQAMRSQRASMQQELDRLDRAISALQAVVGSSAPARSTLKPSGQSRGEVSQTPGKRLVKVKPKISAQGLRNIIAAQNKRWAKVRAAAKAEAKAKLAAGKKPSE